MRESFRRIVRFLGAAAVAALAVVMPASAQAPTPPAADLSAGWVGFADDGVVSEGHVGGALRWYVSPKVAIGPEFVYMRADTHSHRVLTGNVTVDLFGPSTRSVMPFVVVGGGMFQTRQRFRGERFTSTEGAFTVGAGVRSRVNGRVTIGLDARIGWEPHLRLGGVLGVNLGP